MYACIAFCVYELRQVGMAMAVQFETSDPFVYLQCTYNLVLSPYISFSITVGASMEQYSNHSLCLYVYMYIYSGMLRNVINGHPHHPRACHHSC